MTYYNFTDCEQQSRFSKNKHVPVPHAAMRKYYEWRRKVRDFGHDPKTAANSVCDANPEKLHRGYLFVQADPGNIALFIQKSAATSPYIPSVDIT